MPYDRPKPWNPLLTGDDKSEVEEVIDSIAEGIDAWHGALADQFDGLEVPISLYSGLPGIALFYAYLYSYGGLERDRRRAIHYIDLALHSLSNMRAAWSFSTGVLGVCWAVRQVSRACQAQFDHSAIDNIDVMSKELLHPHWSGPYDLLSGLVGLGVYAFSVSEQRIAKELLESVVDALQERAELDLAGCRWYTRASDLDSESRERWPQGQYNLGMAHGISGVIALLAKVYARGIRATTTERLLDGAVKWLLAQRLGACAPSCFPALLAPGEIAAPSRLAWCYGDAGIASALWAAGEARGEGRWKKSALGIARHAANRTATEGRVADGFLCHGSSGLAHIFNRLYHSTGNDRLGEAAISWYRATLEFRTGNRGIAGFWSDLTRDGRNPFVLTGAAGIGLALLAAVSEIEPRWDSMFLLDSVTRLA